MKLKKPIRNFLAAILCAVTCITQAGALEFTYDAPDDYLFAKPTSDDTIRELENVNVDRSKNVALIAPSFGSPTSYLPNSGEYLTPNLVPGALSGGLVNQIGSNSPSSSVTGSSSISGTSAASSYPTIDAGSTYSTTDSSLFTMTQVPSGPADYVQGNDAPSYISYTDVTDDLYYSGGYLGTLKIPAIGVNVKVYQGTDTAALAKGAGHFTDTSIWDGNACFAGHNRGPHGIFGDIHTLDTGDTITLTTKLGTRTYSVTSVTKIGETDNTNLASTSDNRITLFTCVRNESSYRYCVQAAEV